MVGSGRSRPGIFSNANYVEREQRGLGKRRLNCRGREGRRLPIAAEIRSKWGGMTVKAAKSVREAVYGKLQACRQCVWYSTEESIAGRKKDHRWISALCETRCANADELHRKERCALHLTWYHLPTLRGFPAQERMALQLEGEMPWETTPNVSATTAQKLRAVTRGVWDRYLQPYYLTGYDPVKRSDLKSSEIAPTIARLLARHAGRRENRCAAAGRMTVSQRTAAAEAFRDNLSRRAHLRDTGPSGVQES